MPRGVPLPTPDRSNLEFTLNSNQSFHRLDEITKAKLTNVILSKLREIEAEEGSDYLLEFRMEIDKKLSRCNFEDRRGIFFIWKGIEKKAMMELCSRRVGSTALDLFVDKALKCKTT